MEISKYKDIDNLLEETNRQLLNEAGFKQYKALVRIRYNTDPDLHMGSEKCAELLRGVGGITRVNSVQVDKKEGMAIYNVRAISQKNARHCFMAFKQNCLDKYRGMILSVEIGAGSIEEKNMVK